MDLDTPDAAATVPGDDLSALAWVQEELRRSLETAHKALRRHLREAEAVRGSDVDAVDPGILRAARQAFHQSTGALELVGMPAAATVLRASEAAVQRLGLPVHGLTPASVETLERASFALIDFVSRTLAGKPVSALALFPQYRAVAELAAQDRVHPADLWTGSWSWRDLGADPVARPRAASEDSRMRFEHQLLMTLRGEPRHAYRRMGDLCAELGAGAGSAQAAHLWRLAAAFFEAKSTGLLQPDVYSKRIGSRLLAQLRALERGETAVSERLAQDLLFFCAQSASPGDGRLAPRLAAVRQAYGLARHRPVAYAASSLGRFDPAWLTQARKRVAAAKDSWSAVASGDALRSGGLAEQFLLVGDSLRRLYPAGERLAEALQQAATAATAEVPSPALAMEVATGLLSLEASLEDGDLDDPQLRDRVVRLAERVSAVVGGQEAEPLEPWMEDLYRRVSDRQTMGSVVQELRASLSEVEKAIDDHFRQPEQRESLIPVPAKLGAMRGVLSVLGIEAGEQALVHLREEVEGLLAAESGQDPTPVFTRLAGNLGALGFLIDMLSVQPQMAKTLFVYDPESRTLETLMGRIPRPVGTAATPVEALLVEQAQALAFGAARGELALETVSRDLDRLAQQAQIADSAGLAQTVSRARSALAEARGADGDGPAASAALERVSEVLADFVNSASTPLDVLEPLPGGTPQAPLPAAPGEDDDMRQVFLEEAREVIGEIEAAQMQVAYAPHDLSLLTTIRRGFHTLKGSSRMVGLREFGEAAWACEQVFNTRLAEQRPADEALTGFTAFAVGQLAEWVEAVSQGRDAARSARPVQEAAAAIGGPAVPAGAATAAVPTDGPVDTAVATDAEPANPMAVEPPAWQPATERAETGATRLPPDLPTAADLDLGAAADLEPSPEPVPAEQEPGESGAGEGADAVLERLEPPLDFPLLVDQVEPPATPVPVSAVEPAAEAEEPGTAPAWPSDLPVLSLDEAVSMATPAEPALPEVPGMPDRLAVPELTEAVLPLPTVDIERIELDLGTTEAGLPVLPVPAADRPGVDLVVSELDRWLEPIPLAGVVVREPQDAANADSRAEEVRAEELQSGAGAAEPAHVEPQAQAVPRDEGDSGESAVSPTDGMDRHEAGPLAPAGDGDDVKVIGPLRVPIPLFNIYLNEADELSRRLTTEVAEWAMESHRPVGETAVALAHSLGGSSATVGFVELSQLARRFEAVLAQSNEAGYGHPDEGRLFVEVAEEIRRLLHQFAAGFLRTAAPALLERLSEHERGMAERTQARHRADALVAEDASGEAPAAATGREERSLAAESDVPAYDLGAALASESRPEPAPAGSGAQWPAGTPSWSPDAVTDRLPVAEAIETPPPALDEAGVPAWPDAIDLPPLQAAPVDAVLPPTPAPPPAEPVVTPGPVRFASAAPWSVDDDLDAVDAVDAELFPVFDEEAGELLPELAARLRDWTRQPQHAAPATACLRTLHTLKGGARLAGAMRLGEMAHRMEARIEDLLAALPVSAEALDELHARSDALTAALEALRARDASAYDAAASAVAERMAAEARDSDAPPADQPPEVAPPVDADAPLPEPAPLDAAVGLPASGSGWSEPSAAVQAQAEATADVADDIGPAETAQGVADGGSPPVAAEAFEAATDEAATDEASIDQAATAGALDEDVTGPVTGFGLPALPVLEMPALELQPPALPTPGAAPRDLPEPDWNRFLNVRVPESAQETPAERAATLAASAVRVRTPVLERMVGLSGEVSVTRSRIEAGVHQIRSSLGDLTDNLARLREQLRDIELQAETQMSTRREAARAAAQPFDPLEFDRFTRFQELTRMMAESVNDVGTVYRNLQRAVESAEDELAAQARLTRELQDDLLRTRMVEFESLSERLYRVVRQAAKETGKQVRLDIVGGGIEVDRGVLDRMTPAFEHLLRNAVTHGVEPVAQRLSVGKPEAGQIVVSLTQEGNDVSIEFRDDGAGLDLARIRDKGVAMGLLGGNVDYSDAELAQLIFTPGFSTAGSVTELAGRGIGMDVVRSEVNAMGGRIETASAPGQGTAFKVVLPLTTAVTQVVMLRCGETNVAVPATLVEMVRRASPAELERSYASGHYPLGEASLPFHWLGALLHQSARSHELGGRSRPLVIIRSAQQRVALHVDEVLGTQEVVVKNLGPQLAKLPGLAGMTVLASGAIALIYNPVALATAYGDAAHAAMAGSVAIDLEPGRGAPVAAGLPTAAPAPLVLVVDDSLTVRRVTQRLLVREGYRVALAKDGLEAIERLGEERPAVVLTDIEMPRMDGFDLVRNVRTDVRLRSLPVIMITSRIAQKHRDYAAELGVDHYLGKPYSEDELLALVRRYAHAAPMPLTA